MKRKIWLAAAVTVAVVVALAVWLVRAGPAANGDEVAWFVRQHATLWGKIAALAQYDVVKTSEPMACSNGTATYVCLLSKTDVAPIVDALRRYGVEVNVTEVDAAWVLVAAYNFTSGEVQWRNVTATKAWRLQWGGEAVVVYQTPQLKRSLGEMLRIESEVGRRLSALKGVTSVGIAGDKIIVTVENGASGDLVERIIKEVKSVDPEVEVEVVYAKAALA
ncbi:MAG: hypothetical protein QXP98_00040 [Thermoproteus sp.]